ncbi:MAG: carboxypeptidase regulatory-like domain-containing protein, partial [Proteobacteria bacterium]|nr:carboxypeptidase regulatory-like domain-containing protein [Pseudomonadota bacterium]
TVAFSDSTVSVAGTDVFVPGKSLFVRTGSDGTFNFLFVPAGTYSIRIENGKYFKTQEVTVQSGKTTNAGTITVGLTERNPKALIEVIIGKWTTSTYDPGGTGATSVTTTTGSVEVNSDNTLTFTGTSIEFKNGLITATHLYILNDSTMYFRINTSSVLTIQILQVLSYNNDLIVFKGTNNIVSMTRQ